MKSKNLINLLIGAGIFLSIDCSSEKYVDKKEIILPNPENTAHLWIFPDTLYHKVVKEDYYEVVDSSEFSGKKYFIQKFYDSNFNDIYNIAVFYHAKQGRGKDKVEIDSSRAPLSVIRNFEDGKTRVYIYSPKHKVYVELINFFILEEIKSLEKK